MTQAARLIGSQRLSWTAVLAGCLCVLLPIASASAEDQPHAATVDLAQAAMRDGDHARAREVIAEALEADPDDAYLTYNLALTHYAQGDHAQAERIFQEADLKADDDDLHARVLAQLGNIEAHRGRQATQGSDPDAAIDHFRRAHQLYGSALLRDRGQSLARANQLPVGGTLVAMIVERAARQFSSVGSMRRLTDRIELLTSVRVQLEEGLQIDPDHAEAKRLMEEVDRLLVENLTELGDEKLADASAALESDGKLNKALDDAMIAENTFRDALVIEPDSAELEAKLDAATELSSKVLTEMGKRELAEADARERVPEQVQKLDAAIAHFEQAEMLDPGNAEARELREQAETRLAETLEEAGDESVETAERRPDVAPHVALHRERADDAYTRAAELAPEDAELRDKRRENALELAKALETTGGDQLEQGKGLLEENPDAAVARLEAALEDFTTAGDLLAEHGEPGDAAQSGQDEAGELLAGQTAPEPGDAQAGVEPGDGEADPGDAQAGVEPGEGEADPGDAQAGMQPGEGGAEPGDPQAGVEPGQGQAQPGAPQPGAPVPGGTMAARLDRNAQEAIALLQQARSALAAAAEENLAETGGAGVPSYESVAYVMGGSAFDNEEGGGSNEREGNFNTEAMNRPQRDW